ncbi:nuclear protein MDM1 [Megalops cyprinoides]|uniref:nuclear protein MDM1 n=1 Tax=Megalops cyprinoides TaxID=118141 RepID=UPI0018654BE5|nr:nuclear protein MDM1 [Megalops cyprinoides]
MPVKFKGISEYKKKFRKRNSRSGRTSPHLRMREAGLRSDQLGITREPQFLSKKRVPSREPEVSKSFQWEWPAASLRGPDSSRGGVPLAAAAPPVVGAGSAEGPETPAAPRRSRPLEALPAENGAHASPPEPRSPPVEDKPEPALNGVDHVLKRKAGLKSAGRSRGLHASEYQRQFLWKTPANTSPLLAAGQMVYGSSPVIPPFRANPVALESEYKRSFKASPPPRGPRLRRDVEQREEALFQLEEVSPERSSKSKKKKKKKQQLPSKRSPQNNALQYDWENQQQEVRSQSPQEPLPSHAAYRKVKSEYSSNFRSPLLFRYKEGAWVKSSTAGEEVKELREKAEAYRRRAWGTHFSRDHLNQILSEQNRLWEASTPTSATVTERSTGSSTIQALDLARGESAKASTRDGASLSASQRSSMEAAEEAGFHNAPTLPVQRKLAWEEARSRAGSQKEEPHARKSREEEEEEEESDEVPAVDEQYLSTASGSHSTREGGRLPTPKMKTIPTIQRTHHDLTTPVTGGAILVSPPKLKDLHQGLRRSEPPLGKPHSPYKHLSSPSPDRVINKLAESSPPRSSPAAGMTTVDPIPLRGDAWPTQALPDDPPTLRASRSSRKLSPGAAPPPVPVLTNRIHGTLRDPEFQHNGNLGLLKPAFAFPVNDSDVSDNDDRMSQISARSAASCSMASQVLERAQKRRKNFWGKS